MPSEGILLSAVFAASSRAEPDHAGTEGDDDRVRNGMKHKLRTLRQHVEQDVEGQVIALADADGGAEEDEPAHQHDGCGLGPGLAVVEHVAEKDLNGDESRHEHQAGGGGP